MVRLAGTRNLQREVECGRQTGIHLRFKLSHFGNPIYLGNTILTLGICFDILKDILEDQYGQASHNQRRR